MSRIGWISFALAVALATSARAEDFWARKPAARDFENYYPERAAADRRSGEVLMSCRVAADGALTDCQVEREAPAHYDFGAAAIAMARLFRLADGHASAGRVEVALTFAYPDGSVLSPGTSPPAPPPPRP